MNANSHVNLIFSEISCILKYFYHLKGHHNYIKSFFRRITSFMIGIAKYDIAISNCIYFKNFMILAFLIKFSKDSTKHFYYSLRLILIWISSKSSNICKQNCLFIKLFWNNIMSIRIHLKALKNMAREKMWNKLISLLVFIILAF